MRGNRDLDPKPAALDKSWRRKGRGQVLNSSIFEHEYWRRTTISTARALRASRNNGDVPLFPLRIDPGDFVVYTLYQHACSEVRKWK